MKLTTVLLIVSLVQVSAAGLAQKITFVKKDATLKQVFNEINKQTGYSILWTGKNADNKQKINADFNNSPLEEVLKKCLDEKTFTYTIEDKSIVIRQKAERPLERTRLPVDTPIRVSGRVLNEKGDGMPGATVKVKGVPDVIVVGGSGAFSTQVSGHDAVLVISYIGYKTKEVTVSGADADMVIRMEPDVSKLSTVTIVSTGYQFLPKERATGSFEKIDNALFNRTVTPDVISRLDGVSAGVIFDKRGLSASSGPDISGLTIRGLSTLSAGKTPLIVLDNFPYEGDVRNINPNDVESITILKDAAAASIWGVRAGNGVIVITTKKGAYERPLQVSFNSNVTVQDKPDLFYMPVMKTSDFIDAEQFLFSKGAYDVELSDNFTHPYLSPVVEILNQERSGAITQGAANSQIDAFRKLDVRNDYLKYLYRKAVNQQYALNLNGGTAALNYIVSGGYDKDLGSTVKNNSDRLTLRTDLSFKPVKNLEFQVSSIYTRSKNSDWPTQSQLNYGSQNSFNSYIFPYTRLADENGNPLVVGRDYRTSFITDAVQNDPRLVNWQYSPLGELNASSQTGRASDWLLNLGARYKLSEVFSADVKYQYENTLSATREWYGPDSYYMRNLINLFTQPAGSAVEQPLPPGKGILYLGNTDFSTHTLRGQLNVNKNWGTLHQFSAIAGVEQREVHSVYNSSAIFGYDDQNLGYQTEDLNTYYPLYIYSSPNGGFSGQLPNGLNLADQTFRYTSIYANAAYTYNGRYTLSASARKDASNLFGVKTNQRGVPLWSAGAAWNISQEPFYHLDILPVLKFRATYGYNGNTRNNLSAFSTILYQRADFYTNLPSAQIQNPENSTLRWERVGMLNLGLDFGFAGNRVSGSLEYYTKQGKDLLYPSPISYSTGFSSLTTNSAAMSGNGIDLTLHSSNLSGKNFKWNTDVTFSHNTTKVTSFTPLTPPNATYYVGAGNQAIEPILGKPLYAIYSYKWAGLDPQNGDPQGYDSQGKISKDYLTLLNAPVGDLQYNGSAIPLYFGNFRNTLSWKNISVSANIIYKLDYYIRRPSMNYSSLFVYGGAGSGTADYADRWQKPGDEKITNVPSMVYPFDSNRDQFYQNSAALVVKGDHIRLQDITAGYSINKPGKYFKNIRFYGTISNLGIIWRANKYGIDPDYGVGYPAPKTVSFGVNANF